jgi:hypothetical protein
MGEQGLHWAITEAGPFGVLGAIVGAFLAWPHPVPETLGTTGIVITTYKMWHNAFAQGEFQHVVEFGIFWAGVIAVTCGLVGKGIIELVRSSRPPNN